MRLIFSMLLIAIAATLGFVGYFWYNTQNSDAPYGVSFALVDQNGAPITEAAFRGQPTALFFGFTHCPEICPTTIYEINGWFETLGDEAKDVKAYFVTIDPERDTPEVLGNYLSSVTDRVIGITGDPDKVREMASGFGIYFKRQDLDDGDYTMDHSAAVILLDSKGVFRKTIAWGENTDTAVEKMRAIAKQ